jgi:sn-glycerol 3-phosphate transport system substrate-binding protein
MRYRRRALTTVLLAGSLLAAACGGGNGDDQDASGRATPDLPQCPVGALDEVDGPVEVLIWHFLVAETASALDEIVTEYNSSQDKVRVRVESQGTEGRELWDKYRAGISTGDLPAIAVTDDTVTVDIIDSGTVLPAQSCIEVDDYDMNDFLEPAMEYYTIDDVLYPASLNLSSALLYYNKNHFRRADLDPDSTPETLDEVREYAQQIKDAGVVDRPVVFKLGPPLIEMWLTGAGVPIVDNDNGRGDGETSAATFDIDTTVELYTWFQEMERDGLLQVVPDTAAQVGQYLAMAQQTGSMTIETSTAATSIESFLSGDLDVAGEVADDVETDEIDVAQLDIGAAKVPGIDEVGQVQMGGGAWYMTNSGPPHVQAAAWDFMKFFNSVPSQVTWNLRGSYLPYRTTAIDEPAVEERWTTTIAGRWLAIAYEELRTGVDPDFPGPLIGPYDQFRAAIRSSVEELVFAGDEPSTVVSRAADTTTAALQRYADENF